MEKLSTKAQLKVARHEHEINEPVNELVFQVEEKNRITIRKDILAQINDVCKKDELCGSLIEKLIDAEESFIQQL